MARVIILYAPGINCEVETSLAFEHCGADVEVISIKNLERNPKKLLDFDILVLPGGFSYGDSIASGKILSVYFSEFLKETVLQFIKRKTLVLGICNGFQVLLKSGLLGSGATLAENAGGRFEDRWVRLKIKNQKSKIKNIWTNGLPDVISLPVAHREGRVVMKDSNLNEALLYVDRGDNPTMEYPYNPNGSERAIAGICDETGRILGLMPHPERFYLPFQYPGPWNGEVPYGMKIIKNAVCWVDMNKP